MDFLLLLAFFLHTLYSIPPHALLLIGLIP
jgi:hypothetical protein